MAAIATSTTTPSTTSANDSSASCRVLRVADVLNRRYYLPLTTGATNWVQLHCIENEYFLACFEKKDDPQYKFLPKLRDAHLVNNTTEKGPCLFLICPNGEFEFQSDSKEKFAAWLDIFVKCGVKVLSFDQLYRLRDLIGEGSFAKVYIGCHMFTGEEVVLKAVDKRKVKDSNVYTEIEVLRRICHPFIIRLFAAYEKEETICLVLEFLRGGELFDWLSEHGPYSESQAKQAMRRVLQGLQCLHQHGIVHRDLKTENLILEQQGNPTSLKIIDFGLASTLGSAAMRMRCGSPGYVAPEILEDRPYGVKVDMFSAGVILFTILAGYPPFRGANVKEILKKNLQCRVTFNHTRWSPVSNSAMDLILWMTNRDPDRRCSAVQALTHPWFEKIAAPMATNKQFSPDDVANVVAPHRQPRASAPTSPLSPLPHASKTSTTTNPPPPEFSSPSPKRIAMSRTPSPLGALANLSTKTGGFPSTAAASGVSNSISTSPSSSSYPCPSSPSHSPAIARQSSRLPKKFSGQLSPAVPSMAPNTQKSYAAESSQYQEASSSSPTKSSKQHYPYSSSNTSPNANGSRRSTRTPTIDTLGASSTAASLRRDGNSPSGVSSTSSATRCSPNSQRTAVNAAAVAQTPRTTPWALDSQPTKEEAEGRRMDYMESTPPPHHTSTQRRDDDPQTTDDTPDTKQQKQVHFERTRRRARTGAAHKETSQLVQSRPIRQTAASPVTSDTHALAQQPSMPSVTRSSATRSESVPDGVERITGLGEEELELLMGSGHEQGRKMRKLREMSATRKFTITDTEADNMIAELSVSVPLLPSFEDMQVTTSDIRAWKNQTTLSFSVGMKGERQLVTSAYFRACRFGSSRASIVLTSRRSSSRVGTPHIEPKSIPPFAVPSIPSLEKMDDARKGDRKTVRFARTPSDDAIPSPAVNRTAQEVSQRRRFHSLPSNNPATAKAVVEACKQTNFEEDSEKALASLVSQDSQDAAAAPRPQTKDGSGGCGAPFPLSSLLRAAGMGRKKHSSRVDGAASSSDQKHSREGSNFRGWKSRSSRFKLAS